MLRSYQAAIIRASLHEAGTAPASRSNPLERAHEFEGDRIERMIGHRPEFW
jgi:hypothetical protein